MASIPPAVAKSRIQGARPSLAHARTLPIAS
jgi:hypothetical protein